MESLLAVLKALSDATRLRMVNLLYERELCVCDIMEVLQIPQAKASRHLISLKNAGLVKDRKQAQWAYYSLVKDHKLPFMDSLVQETMRKQEACQSDLQRLNAWLSQKNGPCDS